MSKITKEMEKKYVEDYGHHCPFCGSNNLGASAIEVDYGMGHRSVMCQDCTETWVEKFPLKWIEE